MIKFIFKWGGRLLVVLVVVVAALLLLQDRLFRAWLEARIERDTGLEVSLRHAEFRLRRPLVRLEGLRIYNPAGFGDSVLFDLEELHVEVSRDRLRQRQLHFPDLRLNLAQVNLVEDRDGRLNLRILADQLKQRQAAEEQRSARAGKPSVPLTFAGIDSLTLTLGKVRSTNLRYPDKPAETDLGVRGEVIRDIKDREDLQNKLLPLLLRSSLSALWQLWLAPAPVKSAP